MFGTHLEISMRFDYEGRPRFTVEVVDRAGGSRWIWSGRSYERAILEAEAARAVFGPVWDLVLSGEAGDA